MWRRRAQRAYDTAQFLRLLSPFAVFVTALIIYAQGGLTRVGLISAGTTLLIIWLTRVARRRTTQYQQLAQLSNIARGSIGHPKYRQRDYDTIASWMNGKS